MRIFEAKPGREAAMFAEALGLLEDGLDLELVLGLFGKDAEWLAPLLKTHDGVARASLRAQPSYYFEASLKQKFVTAGTRKAMAAVAPAPQPRPVRMALAAGGMAAALAVTGVATLGFITAGDETSDGDWDHVFRLTKDRVDDTLSRRGDPIEFHLRQSDAHVFALTQEASNDEPIDTAALDALQNEAREIKKLAEAAPFDAEQVERVKALEERVVTVLTEAKQAPNVDPGTVEKIDKTIGEVAAAVAAATGGVKPLPDPSPTSTPEGTPTPSPTPTPSTTATPDATATATVEATGTATGTPEATPTPTGQATEPATPSSTASGDSAAQ